MHQHISIGRRGTLYPQARLPDRTPAGHHCVLVVDDYQDSRDTLAALLALSGHTVRSAGSGHEALEIVADFFPDVIFLDIGMPGMNGYELCARLRKHSNTADAAIYAVTGYGAEEHLCRSARAGFDGHFLKPLDPEILERLL